jgi:hypothetical protein
MKTATKVMFANALMLSVVAPSFAHAAYFVDPTKTWAIETPAQDAVRRKMRHTAGAAQAQASRERSLRGFYGTDNTSVPGASFDKDDSSPTLR